MDDPNFGFRVRLALRQGLLYYNDAAPQKEFFKAATSGDLRRLRELASGKDAEGMAWLSDMSVGGTGPFQSAARMGRVDACRCMVEEIGFDINAGSQIGDGQDNQNTKYELKLSGEEAVKRKDYRGASIFYSKAIELNPSDATLYSNRSFCHLQMAEAEPALFDAISCIELRPELLKGYYRKVAALMLLKEYREACDAFRVGLELDPGNAEMEKVFREAVGAMKKHHLATKDF